jgi:hypothetical protein
MKKEHTAQLTLNFKGWIMYLGLSYLMLPENTPFITVCIFSIGLLIVLAFLGLTRF